jgi:hypothetical protein
MMRNVSTFQLAQSRPRERLVHGAFKRGKTEAAEDAWHLERVLDKTFHSSRNQLGHEETTRTAR